LFLWIGVLTEEAQEKRQMSDGEDKADAKGKEEEGEEGGALETNLATKKKFEVKKWAAVALWVSSGAVARLFPVKG